MPQLGLDPIPCVMLESIYQEGIHLWRDPKQRRRCRAMTGSISQSSFAQRQRATNEVLRSVAASHADVLAFFPTDKMCNPDCITSIGDEFLFRDGNHLRRNLSANALDEFAALLGLPSLLQGLGSATPDASLPHRRPGGAR
jgi:SGNH domain (fused to AT3 domains)